MEDKYNVKNMIIFIIIILIILGIFYGITVLVTNNKKENSTTDTTETSEDDVTIDYDTILVQNLYSQSEDSYYVLASFSDDEKLTNYENSISDYSERDDALKVYTIDLSSAFNKNYVADESNFDSEYPTFSETTLLKIENKKITETYVGDEITAALSSSTSE